MHLRARLFSIAVLVLAGCSHGSLGSEVTTPAQPVIPDVSDTSNTWTLGANMPTWRCSEGVAVVGTDVYVIGGLASEGALNKNLAYDTLTNTWRKLAPMPTARWGLTASAVNGIIYAIGGDLGTNQFSNIVEAYDPATDTWTTKSPMPTARAGVASAVLKNVVYVVGGFNGSSLSTVESYHPLMDTWATDASLGVAVSYPNVGTVGSEIVASGGLANTGINVRTTESYNPGTNKWRSRAPAPEGKRASCTAGIGGTLYVASGSGPGTPLVVTESYTLATNTWAHLAEIPMRVFGAGGGSVNGSLYCMGGSNGEITGTKYYNIVQIYQP